MRVAAHCGAAQRPVLTKNLQTVLVIIKAGLRVRAGLVIIEAGRGCSGAIIGTELGCSGLGLASPGVTLSPLPGGACCAARPFALSWRWASSGARCSALALGGCSAGSGAGPATEDRGCGWSGADRLEAEGAAPVASMGDDKVGGGTGGGDAAGRERGCGWNGADGFVSLQRLST